MNYRTGQKAARYLGVALALAGAVASLDAAEAASAVPVPLQVIAVSANAPDAAATVIEGQIFFDGNAQTLRYCIADEAGTADRRCAVENLAKLLRSGDEGPAGGRDFQLRVDAGSSGSVLDSGGTLTPTLRPTAYVTRIATADESFDGYFAFPLGIAADARTGKFVPVIGKHF